VPGVERGHLLGRQRPAAATLIDRADVAMYEAKQAGRDRVVGMWVSRDHLSAVRTSQPSPTVGDVA